ncbi:hypothetical protein Pmani_037583 [Petrolisthes manimaculis]|uniref:Uncharacterized protein n=1 Tax=Petrolisthes manimaculis TaxID=1843537 RepID=A0AAE1TN57_9EUCA|nr:hypothetical protein Pmani_037583 [Petrolisthes manimaculis]
MTNSTTTTTQDLLRVDYLLWWRSSSNHLTHTHPNPHHHLDTTSMTTSSAVEGLNPSPPYQKMHHSVLSDEPRISPFTV